jgi:uncharacterized protein (TIGR01244 family)
MDPMGHSFRALMSFVLALALAGPLVSAQQVTRNPVPGVANFARLETTVACAGATTPEAMPSIKQMGFVSVINLREASENGANVDAEAAAAKAAGLKYFHVPFNGSTPSPQAIEQFLDAITSAGSEPAFIHCSGGNRAAAMWLAKRIAVDHWDRDRAVAEANALGLVNPTLRQFMIDYAQAHKR